MGISWFWLSATDEEVEGDWIWGDGDVMTWTKWARSKH